MFSREIFLMGNEWARAHWQERTGTFTSRWEFYNVVVRQIMFSDEFIMELFSLSFFAIQKYMCAFLYRNCFLHKALPQNTTLRQSRKTKTEQRFIFAKFLSVFSDLFLGLERGTFRRISQGNWYEWWRQIYSDQIRKFCRKLSFRGQTDRQTGGTLHEPGKEEEDADSCGSCSIFSTCHSTTKVSILWKKLLRRLRLSWNFRENSSNKLFMII